jgi:hypothetical protein
VDNSIAKNRPFHRHFSPLAEKEPKKNQIRTKRIFILFRLFPIFANKKNGSQQNNIQKKCLSLWQHAEKGMSSRE